jgi:hypothetical protein
MTIQAVLLPLFAQIFLTFALATWMGVERVGALRRRETSFGDIALGERKWPARAQQIANAFHNQLEFPFLFYVLVILAWMTKDADLLFVIMSWVFVAFRLWHAFEHVTTNNVRRRALIFGGGVITLIAMWVIFAVRVLLGT